jgi:hypothetical protein
MTELLVLGDETIEQLAQKPHFVSEFPFMKSAVKVQKLGPDGKPCLPCNKKNSQDKDAVNRIKVSLSNMSPAKQSRFCQLAQARHVRLSYRDQHKNLVKVTLHLTPV